MFHLPAKTENMPHRDAILKIVDTEGTFIACSQVRLAGIIGELPVNFLLRLPR